MGSLGALDGVRVLEVANFITGPYAGQLLADLGAEVVKLEPPAGDGMRMGFASGFQAYNRNKRSIVVDLGRAAGRRVLQRMVPEFDVLIENMRPGVSDRLGFGYEQVRRIAPHLVYCSISGMGATSRAATRPMYDTTAQAVSGALSQLIDRENPLVGGVAISDNLGGMYAAYGVLGALYARQRTGQGQRIDVSMVGATMAFLGEAFSRQFITGSPVDPAGRRALSQAYLFRCADDKLLAIHLSTRAKFWIALTDACQRADLREDGRFLTGPNRAAHYDALLTELQTAFATRTREVWQRLLDASDVPNAPVLEIDEAVDAAEADGLDPVHTVQHPQYGPMRTMAPGVRLSDTPPSIHLAPPVLGEHTEAVLREHGFDDAAITALVGDGAVGLPQSPSDQDSGPVAASTPGRSPTEEAIK